MKRLRSDMLQSAPDLSLIKERNKVGEDDDHLAIKQHTGT